MNTTCGYKRVMRGEVGTDTVTSLLEGPVWSLHVPPVPELVLLGYSGFLLQSDKASKLENRGSLNCL